MGATQSRPTVTTNSKDENRPCQACFWFGQGLSSVRRTDPIGTPLPDTPVYQRKKREKMAKAMRDPTIFSSRYAGLEKEVVEEEDVTEHARNGAQFYEGPNCEQMLNRKYQLLEVLGVGSTSTVHRCLDKAENKEYACKIIDCQMIEERFQGMMQQFETEIEALRQLQHPGIIRLYDVYVGDDKIYIVMELMEGGELFDYVVQKGTLTEEEAAKIVKKVTSALVYMHEKNIVHRDLKPENLLLKQQPRGPNDDLDVKVIDFGLSKVSDDLYECSMHIAAVAAAVVVIAIVIVTIVCDVAGNRETYHQFVVVNAVPPFNVANMHTHTISQYHIYRQWKNQ
jgi:serine/threonine protein kinase